MLAVVLLTYNRLEYAKTTLNSVLKNLILPNEETIHVHIADDGSPEGYVKELSELCATSPRVAHWSFSNSERRGYGANYNLAMQTVHSLFRNGDDSYVLPLEDDWELYRPLDITPIMCVLREQLFGCVRMGYVGYTQPLRCRFVKHESTYTHWLEFDPNSEEPHVFAGHPRLETVAWERTVGPWPEGLNPGETEFNVAHTLPARQGVAWPLSLIAVSGDAFAHIGTIRSY